MKPVKKTALVVLCLVLAAALTSLYFYGEMTLGQAQPQKPSLQKSFEIFLNGMLQDVQRELRAYKTQRRIFSDLVRPENLRNPSHAEENYRMMQELGPCLRLQIQEILNIFLKADRDIETLLKDEPGTRRQEILRTWDHLKKAYVAPYHDYFKLEEEILNAHEELMTFYFVHARDFRFDPQSLSLEYMREADRLRSQALMDRIFRLSAAQDSILK